MFGWELGFNKPWWLLLLALAPLLWVWSFRSLAGLGRWRRLGALLLRTAVLAGLVLALAEVQLLRTSDRLTVLYLLDQSESIPRAKREAMLRWVGEEVSQHRRSDRRDRAGVIVFGREANIEIPPFDDDLPGVVRVESLLRGDATNVAAALKLAQASFPEDSARRIVLVTDGNENVGDARAAARALAESGIGVDVVPVTLETRAEVAVEKVAMPSEIRRGQPIEARVVVNNLAQPTEDDPGLVPGRLRLTRRMGPHEELLDERDVELRPGKNVFRFRHTIDQPDVYTYQADFTPANPDDDLLPQNNRAMAFTHVRGQGRVLLIEDWENKGEFDYLIDKLRSQNIEVTVQPSDQLFTTLAELQGFDSVILAGTPRSSGEDARTVSHFSDEQIEMLVRNTQQMGAGLVMLGGPNAFGAGGWSNTRLEEAMPVDFQIKNARVQAVGALVLLMHASELAQGNHWQKVTARVAIDALGPMDYCGLLHWNDMRGTDDWLWGAPGGLIQVAGQKPMMTGRVTRMTPGDMPAFDPGMQKALAGFNRVNASVKHMIIISDGDPTPPSAAVIAGYQQAGVKISTVAIGTHGPPGSTPLQNIATATGGKYYVVTNPQALPRIYQREARKVARPLIFEPEGGVTPQIVYPHEMLQGIDGPLPPLKGFVMTTVKENPLVEVSIRSPQPTDAANSTILASWTYGLGRTAVFTSDAGRRWADQWTDWPNYDKFFSQLVRWSMRPSGDTGRFNVAADVRDGKVQVVVTALDQDDSFLNFLNLSATALGPDLQPVEVKIRQTAPGRYVGEFDAAGEGNYFLNVNVPGDPNSPDSRPVTLSAGVNVPYSAEYADRETNLALLEALADVQPAGGEAGAILHDVLRGPPPGGAAAAAERVDTFRHTLAKAVSRQDVWPLVVVIAACVFFGDVLVRRVAFSLDWFAPAWAWVAQKLGRDQTAAPVEERLARLRSRKAEISESIDERRAAARFEPTPDAPARSLGEALSDAAAGPADKPSRGDAARPSLGPGEKEADSYTARLLKAKQQARRDTQQDKPD